MQTKFTLEDILPLSQVKTDELYFSYGIVHMHHFECTVTLRVLHVCAPTWGALCPQSC